LVKILLADDDAVTRIFISRLLTNQGYSVDSADRGDSAFEKAVSNTPDAILLDVMMPGLDGFEVLSLLKNYPGTKDIPVIMLTWKDHPKAIAKALEKGSCVYIFKPVDSKTLVDSVVSAMDAAPP